MMTSSMMSLCDFENSQIFTEDKLKLLQSLFFRVTTSKATLHTADSLIDIASGYIMYQHCSFSHYYRRSKLPSLAVPDSKVYGANMGPTWGRQCPCGPHVGHVNFAIWGCSCSPWKWLHDDIMTRKNFPHFWPFVRRIHLMTPVDAPLPTCVHCC